jgi:hypothetical protein
MKTSKLSNLLTKIEESSGAFSIQALARELDLTPERVQSMLEYWVRKGKIESSTKLTECDCCSSQGNCPFVLEMPRTYELVMDQDHQSDQGSHIICTHN